MFSVDPKLVCKHHSQVTRARQILSLLITVNLRFVVILTNHHEGAFPDQGNAMHHENMPIVFKSNYFIFFVI